MTVELARVRLKQGKRPKLIFTTVSEAKVALAADTLGTIYRTATGVYVVTATGSGTFGNAEWKVS